MKRKVFLSLFLVLFFGMSLILSIGMFVFGESEKGKNELTVSAPELVTKDKTLNFNYLSDFSNWVNNRFFLRQELITLDNAVTSQFGVSGENQVILGKDGWLFFKDTLNDYTGTEQMSERELFSVAKNIELMNEYCQSTDRDFSFVIAPNKNSIYGQYMPNYGVKNDVGNAERLLKILSAAGIKSPDLFEAIRGKNEQLYFKHDSHWNSKGAALGADVINAAFDVKTDYFNGNFDKIQSHSGDLFEMTYPSLTDTETDTVSAYLEFEFVSKATRPDSITLETVSKSEGSLLAYRDSFGNLLFPYLAASYGECRFSRAVQYDLTFDSDYVMVEIVERNLNYLLKYLPIMPSPEREISVPETVVGKTVFSLSDGGKAPEGTVALTGKLPVVPDDTSAVYVVGGDKAFEAFLTENNGFCVYIPQELEADCLVFTVGGKLIRYDF